MSGIFLPDSWSRDCSAVGNDSVKVLPRFNSSFFDDVLDNTNEKARRVGY